MKNTSNFSAFTSYLSDKADTLLAPTLTNMDSFGAYLEPIIQVFKPSWRHDAISAKVISLRSENEKVFTLTLRPSSKWQTFNAGQFVQITVERQGSLVTRTFSISSAPNHFGQSGLIELSIRILDNGLMTPWIFENLNAGDTVYLSQASGEFTLSSLNDRKLFLAGGSGVTPIRSMLNENLGAHWFKDSTLLFYVNNAEEALFSEDIKRYEDAGLNCHVIYSDDSGFISEQHLSDFCPDFAQFESYICGPSPMIEASLTLLRAHNISEENIHFEYFGAAPLSRSLVDTEYDDEMIQVDYLSSNKQVQFNPNDLPQTLLDLAEQEGLKPVSGCRIGVCHQCICKKKQGRVYNTKTKQYSDTGAEEIQLCLSVPVGHVELEL